MQLKDILYKVNLTSVSGDMGLRVNGVQFDSRKVKKGNLFVAVKGTQVDGHEYIEQAIKNSATAIVCENMPFERAKDITFVATKNSSHALGIIASNYYGNPSEKLQLVGITGTNGKTTTVNLLYRLFRSLGYHVGMLSTVGNAIDGTVVPASHTTPDSVSLNGLLAKMLKEKCQFVFMEVSSHAIDQNRIAGLAFVGAAFMNISHDHLDYHTTFENYINSKKRLFDELPASSFALANLDDKRGQVMIQNTNAKPYSFGLKFMTDYKAKVITNSYQGLELDINGQSVWFRLIGKFNAYNLLAAYAIAELLHGDNEEVLVMLSGLASAPGRFESIRTDSGIIAFVDYAHTPDALENVLQTIDGFRSGKEQVITVVGCGGNRDKDKRAYMAYIAVKWSDKIILTEDNPRHEEAKDIIDDMLKGIGKPFMKKTLVIPDRKEAIKTACSMAKDHDIILVAGKGHEGYQEIKGERIPFDDRKILKEMLELFRS